MGGRTMHILTIGLNYKTAPVAVREKMTFVDSTVPDALQQLKQTKSILECVILATCNRTEIYAVVDQLHTGRHFIRTFLEKWFGVSREYINDYVYIHEDDEAIQHLFRVTCGLNSMVIGETQILGQVKDAFSLAMEEHTTGTIFNMLFKQAVTLGKRAHAETSIGENAVSVSYAAIELGKKIFGQFQDKNVLIIGAGKMSELAVKHLHSNGAPCVYVVNRTYSRAQELAEKFHGTAHPIEELESVLEKVDIVISSTGADHLVLTKPQMAAVMKKRKNRPLFMIDIAVPRDLDPEINDIPNIYLYDIDDLEGIVEFNIQERQKEAAKIDEMIEVEFSAFGQWMTTLGVVPIIKALRKKALSIQEETMRSMENKMPNLTERELKVLHKHTKSIVNQLLRDPILRIKEMSGEPGAEQSLQMFEKIFALEDWIADEKDVTEAEAALLSQSQDKRETCRPIQRLQTQEIPVR
jgi:glutamyl-tRNA reductase